MRFTSQRSLLSVQNLFEHGERVRALIVGIEDEKRISFSTAELEPEEGAMFHDKVPMLLLCCLTGVFLTHKHLMSQGRMLMTWVSPACMYSKDFMWLWVPDGMHGHST